MAHSNSKVITLSHDSSIFTSLGAHESLEQSLINDLLKGYNKDAHPIPEQNKSSYAVTFGLELVQLVNVVSPSTLQVFLYLQIYTLKIFQEIAEENSASEPILVQVLVQIEVNARMFNV